MSFSDAKLTSGFRPCASALVLSHFFSNPSTTS